MASSIFRRCSKRRLFNNSLFHPAVDQLYTRQCCPFSVIQARPTMPSQSPLDTPTIETEALQSNTSGKLSIYDLNEMVIDPEKYDALKLRPYFRRIPREGFVMHSFVLTWYSFSAFAILVIVGTTVVSFYDVYVTKESVDPKDKTWAKDMNILQKMYYDWQKKKERIRSGGEETPTWR